MCEVAFDTCVTVNLAPSKVSHVSDVGLTPINQRNLSNLLKNKIGIGSGADHF